MAKVWYPPPLGRVKPAAQTSVADPGTALTPVMIGAPSGPTGVVSGVHEVPFQCRTPMVPSAQTLVEELAVTEASVPLPRFGSVATDQAVPFQCRAIGLSGRKLPDTVSTVFPTAHTSVGEISATPFRVWRTPLMGLGVAGLGLGTIVQAEPFQCMVSVKLLLVTPLMVVK